MRKTTIKAINGLLARAAEITTDAGRRKQWNAEARRKKTKVAPLTKD